MVHGPGLPPCEEGKLAVWENPVAFAVAGTALLAGFILYVEAKEWVIRKRERRLAQLHPPRRTS